MIHIDRLMGRLGNKMFQLAYLKTLEKRGINRDIYLQDPSLFDHGLAREMFGTGIKPVDRVAIHLRRGDYVNNPFYVDLAQTDYYEKAMAHFPNESFLVFSDDIDFARQYFRGPEYAFSDDRTELEDLNLMAGCKGVIAANSSFSWWGGFLCKGKVVAPKAWYADGVERTKCPDNWIRL